ncbi:MAG: 6-phosphogluconolactonase [Acidimicrobiia bacterium]
MRVRVFENPDALAEMAAAAIATWLRQAAEAGRASLGLAGGGTPGTTYARLRDEDTPWERVDAWLGDERWVPPDHPDNNGRLVRRTLLDHVPARFHPVPWEVGSPEEAARRYEETLRGFLRRVGERLRPDVVVLGLGRDGHCASLFPDAEALEERHRLYVATWVPKLDAWRLTATLPLLHAARRIVYIVTGHHKARAVAEALEEVSGSPANRAMRGDAEVTWFLDTGAASRLEDTEREFV